MRTTDPTPEPFKPLGKRIEAPKPERPEWHATGTPGIQRNAQGQLRTNILPDPPSRKWLGKAP